MQTMAILMTVCAMLLGGQTPANSDGQSRDLYKKYADGKLAGNPQKQGRPGAKVRLELLRDGERSFVPANTVFTAGDKVKFHFEVNFPAYVVISNKGTSGQTQLLFPYAGSEQLMGVTQDYVVPSQENLWFEFDDNEGTEELTFIFSRAQIWNASMPANQPDEPAGDPAGKLSGKSATKPAGKSGGKPPHKSATKSKEEMALEMLNKRALESGNRDLKLTQVSNEEYYVLGSEQALERPLGFTVLLRHK